MSRTTSVIPEELEAIISSLKLGNPTWTLHKTERGYGVKLFWKSNYSNGSGTSFNAHSSRRHLRGKRRMEEFLQKKHEEGKYRAHTYSQEAIQSPTKPKVDNPPASPAQRCEIRNSSPNAASQQQFADPVEWKDPSCAQQTTTLKTRGDVESGGLIRDADGDLHKSPEPAPPIPAEMALNELELTTPSLMSSEPDDYTEKNPDLLACSSVVYEARDSTPGVKFKTQSGCDGWTPVTQAESRRRPEHGNGTKANPKIPDYSGSELPVNFARGSFLSRT